MSALNQLILIRTAITINFMPRTYFEIMISLVVFFFRESVKYNSALALNF